MMKTTPLPVSRTSTPYPVSDKTVSEETVMYDIVQVAGSLLILIAFVTALSGRLDQSGYPYLISNALGSAILAVTAVITLEWGFILLEGVWAIASTYTIIRKATGRRVAVTH